jgi:hypothetical protein
MSCKDADNCEDYNPVPVCTNITLGGCFKPKSKPKTDHCDPSISSELLKSLIILRHKAEVQYFESARTFDACTKTEMYQKGKLDAYTKAISLVKQTGL